jgi:paraquat-inducible protein A
VKPSSPAAGNGGQTMKYLNLALLILFPVAWFAPLLRAAILPIFGMDEISVITGLQSLWESDAALALIVTFLAIFAPYAKTIGLALLHFNLLSPKVLPALEVLGKLAMADVFLIALYIVIVKGAGMVTIETAWGLYLFTGCVLASIFIAWKSKPQDRQGKAISSKKSPRSL